jgi:hypothetical protein
MKRGQSGETLTPGRNTDKLNIAAGIDAGTEIGYDDLEAETLVEFCLNLWARGEEDRADRTWVTYYPRDFTSWRRILATAITAAQ